MSERTEFPPGIHRGISYDKYAAWPGERKTYLWHLLNHSVEHYEAKMEEPAESTSAMEFGKMFHSYLLTPDLFKEEFMILEGNLPRKGSKARKTLEDEAGDRSLVSPDDFQAARLMAAQVVAHPYARKFFKDDRGEAEVSILWEDPDTGIFCQGRLDLYIPGAEVFLDVKTTRNAHPEVFGKDAAKFGYFMQAAFYYDGLKILTGTAPYRPVFIAVEKTNPFAVSAHEIDPDELEYGRLQYQTALYRLSEARVAEDRDPCPYPGVSKLTPPRWATIQTIYD